MGDCGDCCSVSANTIDELLNVRQAADEKRFVAFGAVSTVKRVFLSDRRKKFLLLLFGIGWGLAGLCPGPALAVIPLAPSLSPSQSKCTRLIGRIAYPTKPSEVRAL
ncbi:DUF6691 family protein [Parvularcula lutaonensis]|uniref:DUF6691 family protein n=1 Tax=Parvularcula lutaonensis TaxID=491923 RepID=A0ABV7ME99_9PROT